MSSIEEISKAAVTADLARNLTPLIISRLGVDALMMGVIGSQFLRYLSITERESLYIKLFIYLAMAAAVATTCFTWAMEVNMFAYNYGQYTQFTSQHWSAWYGFLCSMTKIPVQAFYGERAWRINNRSLLISATLPFTLSLSAIGSIGFTIVDHKLDFSADISYTGTVFFYLWPTACIVSDLINTCGILWGLHKSRTGWIVIDKLIYKLMRIAVEAQIPPTVFASIVLMAWSQKMSSISTLFMIILPKVYLTGALSVLNSRDTIRQNSSTYYSNSDFNSGQKSSGRQANTGVTVSTDTYVESHFSYEAPKMGLNRILAKDIPHDSVDDLEAGMTLSMLPLQMSKEDWADDSKGRVHI
ncbi:hypothetical protein I314_04505 [Cryptococcus bacillisporus CA1873]|uniref:DUF6534 domain-containing protein n=1 Tax=Cryptococcus bacillisporus CA1873 TaxID=1296111 RepID=A0ABR5B7E4_CRYGA|nr:hypothetical protein I314_04505 [Cryptococcus bacillisporus CA1873]|eukprot:KIR59519.1 hypothetical protein I314_04505 [Cryptococcus gattii CA1873]